MNLSRAVAVADIILRGHILNPFWLPRDKRREIRTNITARVIPHYFKRYLPAAGAVRETKVINNDKDEKIYTLWLQGEENAPDLVKACFRSVRKNCTQELVVLDEKTVFDYIRLPEKIMEKRRAGKIKNAHFADICRVELLYQYGGYWFDSTDFVTSPIPYWVTNTDFFMFLTGNAGSPYSFVQNCFIRGRRGSYLLAAWRAMMLDYWMNENHTFDYFMHQLLFKTLVMNDPRAKKYFTKMPHVDQDPTHALWWEYKDKPFDKKTFDEITSKTFFQKTTYKGIDNIIPGSFADEMINKMYKD